MGQNTPNESTIRSISLSSGSGKFVSIRSRLVCIGNFKPLTMKKMFRFRPGSSASRNQIKTLPGEEGRFFLQPLRNFLGSDARRRPSTRLEIQRSTSQICYPQVHRFSQGKTALPKTMQTARPICRTIHKMKIIVDLA
ncbi:hypothetical protein CPSG_04465 [Coccidioides posadasii str. Silveira]|uniref:Uncharacterized protein n=1 Tax=Coccidioides posadasii (strain RMSCC 757 / Silveira) TaxID=443226 RepID=E9D4C6_COCPS|nr:hypothetical protein CPSG_04465 [Coccidioides posadasii str. Silveira]